MSFLELELAFLLALVSLLELELAFLLALVSLLELELAFLLALESLLELTQKYSLLRCRFRCRPNRYKLKYKFWNWPDYRLIPSRKKLIWRRTNRPKPCKN